MSFAPSSAASKSGRRASTRTVIDQAVVRQNLLGLLNEFKSAIFLPIERPDRVQKIMSAATALGHCFGNGRNHDHTDLLTKAREMAVHNKTGDDIVGILNSSTSTN